MRAAALGFRDGVLVLAFFLVQYRDSHGYTAADYARMNDHEDLAQLLDECYAISLANNAEQTKPCQAPQESPAAKKPPRIIDEDSDSIFVELQNMANEIERLRRSMDV